VLRKRLEHVLWRCRGNQPEDETKEQDMKNEMPELRSKVASSLALVAHEDISANARPSGAFVEITMLPAMEDLGGGKKDLRQAIQISSSGKSVTVARSTGPEKIAAHLEKCFTEAGNRRVWVSRQLLNP
jgi:hypothetical protein